MSFNPATYINETKGMNAEDYLQYLKNTIMDFGGTYVSSKFKSGDQVFWIDKFNNGDKKYCTIMAWNDPDVIERAKEVLPLYGVKKYGGKHIVVFLKSNTNSESWYLMEHQVFFVDESKETLPYEKPVLVKIGGLDEHLRSD